MDYKKLEEIIANGEINIEEDMVWICDYRLGEKPLDKPIRHVKPIQVKIVSNEKLPKNKRVYYSSYHFRPLNKNGTLSSRIIAPYDNTGYRSYTGVSLNIFLKESDCREFYTKQCEGVKKTLERYKLDYIYKFDFLINEVEDLIKNNK